MPEQILEFVRPFGNIVPTITEPDERSIKVNHKMVYTLLVLVFYLVCSKIPLYGLRASPGEDPLRFYRVMLASNFGTLMELGISPIITGSMIVQGISGMQLIKINRNNADDVAMYQVFEKLIGIIVIVGQAVFYTVFSGMYGSLSALGFGNTILIITQLCFSSFIVMMLDDFLSKGYGFGSAISLFISANLCGIIFWQCFSYRVVTTIAGPEYEGALVYLSYVLITSSDRVSGLRQAFFRTTLPNVSNLLSTLVVFLIVIYFQGFRVDIPIKHQNMRTGMHASSYPIKLFYTSNMPIMLQSAMTSVIFMVSSIFHKRLGHFGWVSLIGRWQRLPNGQDIPVGGLVYYITAPKSTFELFSDPIHTIVYVAYVLTTCAVFAQLWLSMSGSSAKDVAKNLQDQGMTVVGFRSNTMHNYLNRYIPVAAALGGLCVGVLSIFADFMNAIGSGTGILLAVGNILNVVETMRKENEKDLTGGFSFSSIFS